MARRARDDLPAAKWDSDRRLRLLTLRERELREDRHPHPGPSPHTLAVLAAALVDARLNRRQRRALRLLAAGHTQREIARDLGCHEATASRIIVRARAAIADLDPRS